MYALIKQQLPELLEIQNRLNCVVSERWQENHYPWHRAAMVEAVEAMEHFGWKWWKKQDADMWQVKLELVDILCFMLSEGLQTMHNKGLPSDDIGHVEFFASSYSRNIMGKNSARFVGGLDDFVHGCSAGKIPVHKFWELCACIGLEWSELRLMYLGKQALNHLRQANGYKTGEYIKQWHGKEDNDHLAYLIDGQNITQGVDVAADRLSIEVKPQAAEQLISHIQRQLQSIYDSVKSEQSHAA